MRHPTRYVVNLMLLTLAACQDPTSGPELGDSSATATAMGNTWQKRIQMPTDRRWVMTATVEPASGSSFLYAIGGQSMNATQRCSGSLSKVQAYDGNTNRWTTKAPMPEPTHRGFTGVVNGRVYVVGGCRESYKVWEYTVATNTWRARTSAPLSLPSPRGSVVGGKLYVFDECSWDACVWDTSIPWGQREQYTFFGYYDPATDRWVRLPLPPFAVWPIVAATFNGKLYFLNGQGQVHIYTPATGVWAPAASRGQGVGRVTSAVVRGKWYVVGQEASGANFLSVYDPAANTWTSRAAPPDAYYSDTFRNGPSAGRVWANGVARLELVGGARPENNWQYTP